MEGPAEDERVEGWSSGAVPTRESGGRTAPVDVAGTEARGALSAPHKGSDFIPSHQGRLCSLPTKPCSSTPWFLL